MFCLSVGKAYRSEKGVRGPASSDSDESIVTQVSKRSKALSDIQINIRNKSMSEENGDTL